MNWLAIGVVVVGISVVGMWASTLALFYLRGSLDTLAWSLALLEWKSQEPKPKEPQTWSKLLPYVAADVLATVAFVVMLIVFFGGRL